MNCIIELPPGCFLTNRPAPYTTPPPSKNTLLGWLMTIWGDHDCYSDMESYCEDRIAVLTGDNSGDIEQLIEKHSVSETLVAQVFIESQLHVFNQGDEGVNKADGQDGRGRGGSDLHSVQAV